MVIGFCKDKDFNQLFYFCVVDVLGYTEFFILVFFCIYDKFRRYENVFEVILYREKLEYLNFIIVVWKFNEYFDDFYNNFI